MASRLQYLVVYTCLPSLPMCSKMEHVLFSSNSSESQIFFKCFVIAGLLVPNNSAICFQRTLTRGYTGNPFLLQKVLSNDQYYLINNYQFGGNTIFSTLCASSNSGEISSSVNPAIPQPMRVTRNVSSGCCLANWINSTTNGRMVSTPPCIVGMAQLWPCRPTPCPMMAPNLRQAM